MGRMDRINELMKREIGLIIQQELHDPRFQFVSVTSVNVSPDLQTARVGFSFLGDRSHTTAVQDALSRAGGRVRHLVSQRIELRHTPRIEFIYDPSLDYSANVEEVLEDIKRQIPFEVPEKTDEQRHGEGAEE